ncbi:SspB family protein [Flexibacterium corallicola]|uniref:SspB family protein n=1 Tax=Flexibacterium corallicola TaxID=3037259 RepID=UPI00286F15AE|nr:ClpXP protease specificity-enhancing factor SspB [Pseudovibrio sp. M1P-2-3]
MAEDLIRYDIIIQDALRGAVRKILNEVLRSGLPGEHHFYIAFETTAPGVKISNRLRERYPQEMTVVMQHQFWDLQVGEHAFEVGLSFGGVPEKLYIPFSAIKGFFDPSVQFALEFEPGKTGEDLPEEFRAKDAEQPSIQERHLQEVSSNADAANETSQDAELGEPIPEGAAPQRSEDNEPPQNNEGAHVVSLDAFRKKN